MRSARLRDAAPEPPRDLWARTAAAIERESGAARAPTPAAAARRSRSAPCRASRSSRSSSASACSPAASSTPADRPRPRSRATTSSTTGGDAGSEPGRRAGRRRSPSVPATSQWVDTSAERVARLQHRRGRRGLSGRATRPAARRRATREPAGPGARRHAADDHRVADRRPGRRRSRRPATRRPDHRRRPAGGDRRPRRPARPARRVDRRRRVDDRPRPPSADRPSRVADAVGSTASESSPSATPTDTTRPDATGLAGRAVAVTVTEPAPTPTDRRRASPSPAASRSSANRPPSRPTAPGSPSPPGPPTARAGPTSTSGRSATSRRAPLTTDGDSYFASWAGNEIVASRPDDRHVGRRADRAGHASRIDPATGVESPAGDVWRPAVDPTAAGRSPGPGRSTRSTDGATWAPADGTLELRTGPPTAPGPGDGRQATRRDADAASADFDVRWDESRRVGRVWVADAVDPSVGRLSLYHVDPATGALERADGAPADVAGTARLLDRRRPARLGDPARPGRRGQPRPDRGLDRGRRRHPRERARRGRRRHPLTGGTARTDADVQTRVAASYRSRLSCDPDGWS